MAKKAITAKKKAAPPVTRSKGEGRASVNTVHVKTVPQPKIGENILFFPGAHDAVFPGAKTDRFSATISNVHKDGSVNLHVFNDGPDRAYRTNIAHRSLAAPGMSYWEWVESI